MAKSNGKSKGNVKNDKNRKKDSAELKRAEKRLSTALEGLDAAREKVSLRERDLAKLMKSHGHTAAIDPMAGESVPPRATSHTASENGAVHDDDEPPIPNTVEDRAEHAVAPDGSEHHG